MRYDYAVVGAGVMGAATAAALAERGSVVLLEQFALGHTQGSSHGRARIFRFSYPDPYYVALAQEALDLWRAVENATGQTLLDITGGLDIGEGIEQNADALQACGASYEVATGRELVARFPYLNFEADVPVLFSPDSGTIAAEKSVRAFADLARAKGATFIEGARVEALEQTVDGVRLRVDKRNIWAGVVVVTAGAWAKELLSTTGIELPVWVTRETVAYFDLEPKPPTLVDWGDPLVYALPSPGQGLKAAQHIAGPRVAPGREGVPDESSVEVVSRWVAQHYPSADPVPRSTETCLYTNTDDQSFILERHDDIVVGSPCSGHGFKFAPLIGRRLADLASRD